MTLRPGNPAVTRALHGLSHGVSIAAIVLLLLNDHYLRVQHPSWLTGKLGDFAWLVFAPFICALAIGVIARGRVAERTVGAVAFVFIGLWFALAKTTGPVHRWTTVSLDFILGYRGSLRMDPTDLLVLPALWLGWSIWKKADNHPEAVKAYVWVLMAAGVMATVATSGGYAAFGIVRVCSLGETVYAVETASNGGRVYASVDGGITWLSTVPTTATHVCADKRHEGFPTLNGRPYRLSVHERKRVIESSGDGGKNWMSAIDLPDLHSESRRVLYADAGLGPLTAGPLDIAASAQGTLVVAMGTDGVLVQSAAGEWRWVQVGEFRYREFTFMDRAGALVSPRIAPALPIAPALVIAGLFVALSFLTIGRPLTSYTPFRKAVLAVSWIVFGLAWLPVPVFAINLLFPYLFPVVGGVAIVSAIQIRRLSRPAWLTLAGFAAVSGALFTIPFFMWAYGTVPVWEIAHLYATGLGIAAVVSCRIAIRVAFPDLFGRKKRLTVTMGEA